MRHHDRAMETSEWVCCNVALLHVELYLRCHAVQPLSKKVS